MNKMNKMNKFRSKEYGCLKIECKYNTGGIIIFRDKFSLRGDNSNKIRNIFTV
jgi:hypothetical protein